MSSFDARQTQQLVNGCIVWTGARTQAGYGVVRVGYSLQYVHRLAYVEAKGQIPEEWVLRAARRSSMPGVA